MLQIHAFLGSHSANSLVLSALAAALDGPALSAGVTCSVLDIFVLEVFPRARILILFDDLGGPVAVRICLGLLGDRLLTAVFDNS